MYMLRESAKTEDAIETKDKLVKILFACKQAENKLDEYCTFGTDQGIAAPEPAISFKLSKQIYIFPLHIVYDLFFVTGGDHG